MRIAGFGLMVDVPAGLCTLDIAGALGSLNPSVIAGGVPKIVQAAGGFALVPLAGLLALSHPSLLAAELARWRRERRRRRVIFLAAFV